MVSKQSIVALALTALVSCAVPRSDTENALTADQQTYRTSYIIPTNSYEFVVPTGMELERLGSRFGEDGGCTAYFRFEANQSECGRPPETMRVNSPCSIEIGGFAPINATGPTRNITRVFSTEVTGYCPNND
jgi:hypothetical protein